MKKNLLLILFSGLVVVASAQQVSVPTHTLGNGPVTVPGFEHQLKLVDSIRVFIKNELKLSIGNDFYTGFESGGDSMYVFLYLSRGDTIALPANRKNILWRIKSEDSAIVKSNALKQQGYHTLIYKTAGTSGAALNRKLLSYPDEAIAFILFHEAVHRHVGMEIEYEYIEALCDAMASLAIVRFAEKTKMLDLEKVNKQKAAFENAYMLLNKERVNADKATIAKRAAICARCDKKIKLLIRTANQFVKDRMGYKVNNAYFLRVEAYAKHYFELKEKLAESNLDIDKAMTGLPTIVGHKDTKTVKLPVDSINAPLNPWGRW